MTITYMKKINQGKMNREFQVVGVSSLSHES